MNYMVRNYETAEELSGAPDEGLVQASLNTEPTGAVAAYEEGGTWHYVPESEVDHHKRFLGHTVLTVYVDDKFDANATALERSGFLREEDALAHAASFLLNLCDQTSGSFFTRPIDRDDAPFGYVARYICDTGDAAAEGKTAVEATIALATKLTEVPAPRGPTLGEELTKAQDEVLRNLHEQVDGLTRPRCKAAASFTKRRADDLKAGMSDGVRAAFAAVRRLLP